MVARVPSTSKPRTHTSFSPIFFPTRGEILSRGTVEVSISVQDCDQAREYSRLALERLSGPNYTGLHLPERFYVGRCGEIGFGYWAQENGLLIEDTVQRAGVPDEQDFLQHHIDGRILKLNVKNSHHPRARYLMQPRDQYDKFRFDLYVGCSGRETDSGVDLTFWGAMTSCQFSRLSEEVQVSILTLRYPLSGLPISMSELRDKTKLL